MRASGASPDAPAIGVEGLTYAYPGSRGPAVEDLVFSIERGEIFGFLGPSGSGKSTTQKILTALLPGWTGRVEIGGRPLRELGLDLYRSIGVGFELPNHFGKLTARENLALFAALYAEPRSRLRDPDELLDLVGLLDDADDRVDRYSKGMKMRLNFVRALLPDPELVFLDEPTSGMDPVNARRIKDLIRDLRDDGRTVFLTTHSMVDADELCDRVAFLVDGRIRRIGAPHELRLEGGSRTVEVEGRVDGRTARARFPLVLYGDIAVIGLMFVAGLLFVERRQGVLEALAVTPTTARAWILSKVVSLTLVATTVASALTAVLLGVGAPWLRLLPSFVLVSSLFTLIGFLFAARFRSISSYLVACALGGLPTLPPVLAHLGIGRHTLHWINPFHAALVAFAESFVPSDTGTRWVVALAALASWNVLGLHLAERAFERWVAHRPRPRVAPAEGAL